jgi:glycosyltransferase involved in cell wall biosynthesis
MRIFDGIKILHIVKGIDIGGNSGGAESFGLRLARSLSKKNMDVSLCAFIRYGTSVEDYWRGQLENDGVKVFYACSQGKFSLWKGRKNIKKWLQEYPADIVHSHYQIGTITSCSLKLSNCYRFLVRTAHADLEFGGSILGSLSRFIFRDFVYPLCVDCEVGVSHTIAQSLNQRIIRIMLKKNAYWIPNAISDSIEIDQIHDPFENMKVDKLEGRWIVTTIGILVPIKNIDLLIRAMPKVLNQIPHAHLVVVGDGPELNNLKSLSKKLGISNYCWFLGQQQNILPILKNSNIFVLPSGSEGISTVILEAIQNKVPVIASDIKGNRELINNDMSGWLVPVGNVDALISAIIRAYNQPSKMMHMAEEAHAQISEYYISNVSSKYREIYLSLMQNSGCE